MKKLFLFASAIILSITFSSCIKNNVKPAANIAPATKSNPTTVTTPVNTVPIIVETDLQGSWAVVSDSSFWAGELPKKLVSAYAGESGDYFNFSTNEHLYIKEDALSDTTSYSIDSAYNINVTYPDAKHFNEAPGFGLGLNPVGFNPTIPVYFRQVGTTKNVLVLTCDMITPDGVASRIIYLKNNNTE